MEYLKKDGNLGDACIFDKNDIDLLSIEKKLEKMYWGLSYESVVKDKNPVLNSPLHSILDALWKRFYAHQDKINIDICKWKRDMKNEYDEQYRTFVVQKEPPFDVMGVVRKEDEVT